MEKSINNTQNSQIFKKAEKSINNTQNSQILKKKKAEKFCFNNKQYDKVVFAVYIYRTDNQIMLFLGLSVISLW